MSAQTLRQRIEISEYLHPKPKGLDMKAVVWRFIARITYYRLVIDDGSLRFQPEVYCDRALN